MRSSKASAENMVLKIVGNLDFKPSESAIDRATSYVEGLLKKSGDLFKIVSDPGRMDKVRAKVIEILVVGSVAKRNPRHGNDDPSRDEMIEHIRKVYGREADEFDIEEAIYWFASDYHGGQGSNLYSALSTSEYRPGRSSSGPEEGSMAEMIYSDLVDTFSPKKNPLKRRKGESTRSFVSRCMSEEKASFPKTKQRIAVCLSKSRKRNPVYDTGSDE